ncbi:uncharacterized protein C8R40DRAFT_1165104 [Lentinula edodes]|uniref:uncharacterized protein n=1 Tax=Lentinula edodes TaxID=5353 RepID=UPI001E8EB303|nr:uncharacterized protein C8R40DRAFT_1165104 [Lentinula edodes]KAH7880196.1 hypothetical protein C8R40DRAFT_1165104 [Lentinula edodes]
MSLRKRSSSDDEGKAPRKRPNILLTSSDNVVEEKNGSDNRKLDRSESLLLAPLLTELHQIFVPGALPPRLTAFASVDLSILAEVLRPCSGCTTLTNCNAGTGTCHDCYTKKEVCSVPTFLRYWIYSDRTGLTLEQTLFMITNYGDHKTKKSFCLDNTVFSNHLRQVVEKSLLPPPLNTGTSVLGDSPTDLENRVKALNLRRSPVVRTVHALENHRPRELLSRDLLTHSQPSSSMAQSHWLYSRSHTELISPIHETPVRVIQAAGHRHFQFVTSTSSSPSENPSSTQCTLCSHSDARFSGPPSLSKVAPSLDECAVQAPKSLNKAGSTLLFDLLRNPRSIKSAPPFSSLKESALPLPSVVSTSIPKSHSIDLSAPFPEAVGVKAHSDQTRVKELEQLLAWARDQFLTERDGVEAHDHIRREIIQIFANSVRQAHASVDKLRHENGKIVRVMLSKTFGSQLKSSEHRTPREVEDVQADMLSRDSQDPPWRTSLQSNVPKFPEQHGTSMELQGSHKQRNTERDAYENKLRELPIRRRLRESCEQHKELTRCEILEGILKELNTQIESLEERFKELCKQRDALGISLETSRALLFLRQEVIARQAQNINTLNEHIQEQQVTISKLRRLGLTSNGCNVERRP